MAAWQPDRGVLDPKAVTGFDAVVHLAGAGIGDRRWSTGRKRLLYDSRVGPTRLLAQTLAGLEAPPRVLISGSAVGYYGVRGDEILTEDASPGGDFLARLTVDWEAASEPAARAGIRLVNIRTGLVIGPSGGFLEPMLPLFRLGVGGRVGSGRQWWSWISLEDEVDAIVHLLESEIHGPVNLAAPNPVTNAEFTAELGRVLGRPAVIPVPGFALDVRLGHEMATLTALASQRVDSSRLVEDGYRFAYPDVASALNAALER
jgi:uncharacterized protein (TIGR01777 family)